MKTCLSRLGGGGGYLLSCGSCLREERMTTHEEHLCLSIMRQEKTFWLPTHHAEEEHYCCLPVHLHAGDPYWKKRKERRKRFPDFS